MSILIDHNTRLLIQGITGREGLFHGTQMVDYGTKVVAGVTPGKGGEWVMDGKIPVFDTVGTAMEATEANCSVIFVPARFAADAILEAADAGIPLIVCITEGVPVQDMMQVRRYIDQHDVRLVGPNCPGLLTPGESKVGIIPGHIAKKGNVGIVSRSGTLTYEVLYALLLVDALRLFEADPETESVVLIGEIGGADEEKAANYISDRMTKPVVGFIAGRTAPPGKRMGHAGAIIEGGSGLAEDKIQALKAAGVRIAEHPEMIPDLLQKR